MQVVGVDWSMRRGCAAAYDNGVVARYDSLDELLAALTQPTVIVLEATFESFFLAKRESFLTAAASQGHVVRVITSRYTARNHRKWFQSEPGYKENSATRDLEDAQVILRMVREGANLTVPTLSPPPYAVAQSEAKRELVILRNSGKKDEFAQQIIDSGILPPIYELPEFMQRVLGHPQSLKLKNPERRKYRPGTVAAVAVLARVADSRRDFDSMSGLWANAHPTMFRSEFMFWMYSKALGTDREYTLSELRRSLRWMWRVLRDQREWLPGQIS